MRPLDSVSAFLTAEACREFHGILKDAGYAVGPIIETKPSSYAATSSGPPWSFQHERAAGDAVLVIKRIRDGASDADHIEMMQRWPNAYQRVGVAMTVSVLRTVVLVIIILGGLIIGTSVLL